MPTTAPPVPLQRPRIVWLELGIEYNPAEKQLHPEPCRKQLHPPRTVVLLLLLETDVESHEVPNHPMG